MPRDSYSAWQVLDSKIAIRAPGRAASAVRSVRAWCFAPAYGVLLTHLGAPSKLARFLVVAALAQLLAKTASLQQPLETAQRSANRFAVVDTHPKRHAFSFEAPRGRRSGELP